MSLKVRRSGIRLSLSGRGAERVDSLRTEERIRFVVTPLRLSVNQDWMILIWRREERRVDTAGVTLWHEFRIRVGIRGRFSLKLFEFRVLFLFGRLHQQRSVELLLRKT